MISLPVPNINEPLVLFVLLAIPITLLATPDIFALTDSSLPPPVISPTILFTILFAISFALSVLVFDSILFNVPITTAPVFCSAYKLLTSTFFSIYSVSLKVGYNGFSTFIVVSSGSVFIYLVDTILYEPVFVDNIPLI